MSADATLVGALVAGLAGGAGAQTPTSNPTVTIGVIVQGSTISLWVDGKAGPTISNAAALVNALLICIGVFSLRSWNAGWPVLGCIL